MRPYVIQGTFVLQTATGADPNGRQVFVLPKGFRGYARVKFQGAAGGDFMYGMFVPLSMENRPQNEAGLSTTNYGVHFADTNEKCWDFPLDGVAFIAIGSAANGKAVVDVAGCISEGRT